MKRRAIEKQDFESANAQKKEIEAEREEVYRQYGISQLLNLSGNGKKEADLPPIKKSMSAASTGSHSR